MYVVLLSLVLGLNKVLWQKHKTGSHQNKERKQVPMIHGGTRILWDKGRAVTKSWSVVEHLKILLMVHGLTRFMCEKKGHAVTKSWPAVEHRELIAGGAN